MFYAIFSEKYMPQFAEFWAAFSTIENAVDSIIQLPDSVIRDYKLELYEIPLDAKEGQGKKRIDANDPRIAEATKSLANRRHNSS